MTQDAEHYFIQLLFCKNRELLRRENRELYDALFYRYEKIYEKGQKAKVNLFDISERFMSEIFGGAVKAIKNKKLNPLLTKGEVYV